ncbi:hypothetical protein LEP1GSC170_0135 [Leptospira interrogans serovar Bataviae str. HAI135]|nr:hypothetical protein LEP1GSC170_0135 [Leptospira interrogans serovar Bataviae str. HAI135]
MDIQKQIEIIRRGTVDLISEEELKSKLQKKKLLKSKLVLIRPLPIFI